MKNKLKRILALTGAILLLLMYAATMLFAIFDRSKSKGWLMASIALTVLVPVLLYAILLAARVLSGKNQKDAIEEAERQMKQTQKQKQKQNPDAKDS